MFDELFTYMDFTQHVLPRLSDTTVKCALCDQTFKRLTTAHLRTHAGKLLEQRGVKRIRKSEEVIQAEQEMQPGVIVSKWTERSETLAETYARVYAASNLLNGLVAQTLELYQPLRTKWVLMEHLPGKAEWMTITPESKGWGYKGYKNVLSKDAIKNHFRGRQTISVYPRNDASTRVLVFDVDAAPAVGEPMATAEGRAKKTTRALALVMKRHKLEPHVVASGGKGYHVELYFDGSISRQMARNVFRYFVNHPDVPLESVNVECLPFDNRIKLPLGINWKTQKFCTYVDPLTLIPVSDPYAYFLEIRPMPRQLLNTIEPEKEAMVPRKRKTHLDDSWSASGTEIAYKVGIEAPGTRHSCTLRAAAYLVNHHQIDTLEEFTDQLIQWSEKQYQQNGQNIRSSWIEHLRDVHRIARYVWKHRHTGGMQTNIRITAADVHWICGQTSTLATQKLLLAALYQYRVVGGPFHFGFARMRDLTGLAKKPLCPAIEELRDQRKILVVVAKYSHQTDFKKGKTTKYTLAEIPTHHGIDTTLAVVNSVTWSPDLWHWILRTLFTVEELKKRYPRAYFRIVKSKPTNQLALNA